MLSNVLETASKCTFAMQSNLRTLWKWFALVSFAASFVVHVAAVLQALALNEIEVLCAVALAVLGQPIVDAGLRHRAIGGEKRPELALWYRWSTWRAALRYVPVAWRIFGLPFWLVYMPAVFFGGQLRLIEISRAAALSALPAAWFFHEYICLAFVIPNRNAILSAAGHPEAAQ